MRSHAAGLMAALILASGVAQAAEPLAIQTGVEVSGEVATPGEAVPFTFEAAAGTRVYVQRTAASNANVLNWALSDPFGRVLTEATSSLADLGPHALVGGIYTLTVTGEGDNVGTFSFIVHTPPATAGAATLGATLTGAFTVPGQRHDTTFGAAPGDVLFLDLLSTSNASGLNWELRDPDGRALLSRTSNLTDVGPFSLAPGEHTLTLFGEAASTGDFEVALVRVEDATLPTLAVTAPFAESSGALTHPGQTVHHPFTLAAPALLALQFPTNSNPSGLNVLLTNAAGQTILPRTPNLNDRGPFPLAAGAYTLTIIGEGAQTGTYTFRLTTLETPTTPLTLDTPATFDASTLGPAYGAAYPFTAAPDTTVFLDLTGGTNTGAFDWRLDDVQGRTLLGPTTNLNDQGPLTLAGGDYTLHILPESFATGTAEFTLLTVGTDTAAITLGAPVTGELTLPGEVDLYTFTAAPGQLLTLDQTATSNGAGLNWRLQDALGRDVLARTTNLNDQGPLALMGGAYTLSILGEGSATGTYDFTLVDAGTATFTPTGTPLALDAVLSDAISVVDEVDTFTLDIAQPTTVFLDLQEGANNLVWSLVDPVGQPVFTETEAQTVTSHDRGPYPLAAGVYTLTLRHTGGLTPTYQLSARAAVDQADTFSVGDVVTGDLAVPGSTHTWTVDLTEPTRVFLDLQQGANQLYWALLDPVGQPVFSRTEAESLTGHDRGPYDLAAGTYTLVIDGSVGTAPPYTFQLHATEDVATAATFGTPLTATFTTPGSVHTTTFEGTAGARAYVDALSTTSRVRLTLTDPQGRVLVSGLAIDNGGDDFGPIDLVDGTYTLTLDPDNDTTPELSYQLIAPPVTTLPIALDTALSGAFTLPGERIELELTLTAPTRMMFDLITPANGLLGTLTSPSGEVLFANRTMNSATADDLGPWLLPVGTVRLSLWTTDGQTPAFELRFPTTSDLDGGEITINQVVSGTLPTPGATVSYTFSPDSPGQVLLFDVTKNTAGITASLYDPAGEPLFSGLNASGTGNDRGPWPLAPGVYTVVIDGSDSATPAYQFRLKGNAAQTPIPEGCAACSALDLVFLFDTSSSMSGEAQLVCDLTADIVTGLEARGIPVTATLLGIGSTAELACVTTTVNATLGTDVPGDPPPGFESIEGCTAAGGNLEQWGLATAVVADRFPWQQDAVRLIMPFSDEGPWCGDGYDLSDEIAIDHAIAVAKAAGVIVSPLVQPATNDQLDVLSYLLAEGTSGTSGFYAAEPEVLLQTVNAVANSACTAGSSEQARPKLVGVTPAPGTVLPAGETVVLSGTVQPVNLLRPVVAVLVNGVPADALDASGNFFAALQVPDGTVELTVELVEECGSFSETVTLTGAPGGGNPFETLAEVSLDVEAEYADTAFALGTDRLLVDATAVNTGSDTIDGPLLMAFGATLPLGVRLANPAGTTPAGEPYVVAVGAGQSLPPGQSAEPVPLAFEDAPRVPVRFQVRWLAPDNRAPMFTTAPVTTARAGTPWAYDADASDPDGHPVSFALVTGPAGLSLDADTGALAWTPGESDVGSHDVRLAASDGRGGTTTQRFTLTVQAAGTNSPPVFTTVPVTHATVGSAYAYAAQATDADGDLLLYTVLSGPQGLAADPGSGLVSWDFALPGIHPVSLRADDGQGGQATQSFTLGVGELPDNPGAPLISSVPPVLAAPDQLWLYVIVATDSDGDPLTYTLDMGPDGLELDEALGRLSWIPGGAQVGTHPVQVTVSDGRGGATSQVFAVTVLDVPPNLPPLFSTQPPTRVVVGDTLAYTAQASDPEGGGVLYGLAAGPTGMVMEAATGELQWTPQAGDEGTIAVGITAVDEGAAVASQAWLLSVRADNAAPEVVSAAPTEVFAGQSYLYKAKATDADGDAVAWALVQGPPGMKMLASTGLVSWVPSDADEGAHPVTIAASDGWGGLTEQAWTLTVTLDDSPPEVQLTTTQAPGCLGQAVKVCVDATDNVGIATRSLTADGAPVALDLAGCALFTESAELTRALGATATDPSGNAAQDQLSLAFVDCTDAEKPVAEITSPAPGSVILGPVDIVGTLTDNNPQSLTWTVAIARQGTNDFKVIGSGAGEVTDGVLATFDPTLLPNDSYRVRILGNDGQNTGGVEFLYGVGGEYKLGNFQVAFNDLALPVAGIPLSITRIYDSLDTRQGDFGAGWRLQLSGEVVDSASETDAGGLVGLLGDEPFTRTTRVTITRPDGRRVGFTFDPTPTGFPSPLNVNSNFKADPGVEDTLEGVGNGKIFDYGGVFFDFVIPYNPDTYILTTREKVKYTISETEGLTHVEDAHGNTLAITPDGIISSTGVQLTFERDAAGRITKVIEPDDPADALPAGELVYTYDAAGNLKTFTDQTGATTEYFYEDPTFPHYLSRIEDPLDRPLMRTVFDEEGRLSAVCGADGDLLTLEGCSTFEHDALGGLSTFVDARGFRQDLLYDERGNVVVERNWLDAVTFFDTVHVYDEDNHEVARTDALGHTWSWTYDADGNEVTMEEPGGQLWTQTWDAACDKLASSCDPLGNCVKWAYDDNCNVRFTTDPLGRVTQTLHDAAGNLTGRMDPLGNIWLATYDAKGLLQTRTDPQGHTETYEHDGLNRLVKWTDRNGRVRTRTYDEAQRLLTETWDTDPPRVITRTWTAAGQLESVTSPDYALAMSYHPTGLIHTVDNAGSPGVPPVTLTYTWDGGSNLESVADSLGGVTTYAWDGLGRLAGATQTATGAGERSIEQVWDAANLLQEVRRYGDLAGIQGVANTLLEYSCGGCPLRKTALRHRRATDGAVIHDITLARDAALNVTQLSDAEGTHTFAVDGARRLLTADHPEGAQPDESFVWDIDGNRLSSHLSSAYIYSYQVEAGTGVELVEDDTFTYEWDNSGSLTKRTTKADGAFDTFAWDHAGRLVEHLSHAPGGEILTTRSFGYSPLGARVRVTEDGVTRHIIDDMDNPALVLDDAGNVLTRRFFGRRMDQVWAEEVAGETRWLLTDHLGSVRDVVDDSAQVLAHVRYSAFGRAEVVSGDAPELQFTAREFSTSGGLGYFRARVYDPDLGRFLSQDPQPPWAYAYADSAPTVFIDPTGETAALEYAMIACDVLAALSAAKGYATTVHQLFTNINEAIETGEGGGGLDGVDPPLTPHSLVPCGLGEITGAAGG